MQASGIAYAPISFVDQWKGGRPVKGLGTSFSAWLAPLNDADGFAQYVQAEAAAVRAAAAAQASVDSAYAALSTDERKAWDAGMLACDEGTGYADAWHPAQYYSLLFSYHSVVNSVDLIVGPKYAVQYADCMARSGLDAPDRNVLLSALQNALPPPDQIPEVGAPGNSAWDAWLGKEADALRADGTCRAGAYAEGWNALGPALARYQSDHQAELAAEEAGWTDLVRAAAGDPALDRG